MCTFLEIKNKRPSTHSFLRTRSARKIVRYYSAFSEETLSPEKRVEQLGWLPREDSTLWDSAQEKETGDKKLRNSFRIYFFAPRHRRRQHPPPTPFPIPRSPNIAFWEMENKKETRHSIITTTFSGNSLVRANRAEMFLVFQKWKIKRPPPPHTIFTWKSESFGFSRNGKYPPPLLMVSGEFCGKVVFSFS